jgi:hypothetical protein
MMTYQNREAWLTASIGLMRDWFTENRLIIPPKIMVAPGFGMGGPNVLGQCWAPKNTIDGTTHLFIAPCSHNKDPIQALGVVVHELCHACVGVEHQHRKPFVEAARLLGLAGPATSTVVAPQTALWKRLGALAEELGDYPNDPINFEMYWNGKKPSKKKEPELDAEGNPKAKGSLKFVSKHGDGEFQLSVKKFMPLLDSGHWSQHMSGLYTIDEESLLKTGLILEQGGIGRG